MKCNGCGREIPNGSKFCRYCGAESIYENVSPGTGSVNAAENTDIVKVPLFCRSCGAEVSSDMLFCRNCGRKTDFEAKTAENVCKRCGKPLKPNTAFCMACGAPTGYSASPVKAPAVPSYSTDAKNKSRNNVLIAILTVLIVLLISVVSVTAYIAFNPESDLAAFITGNDDSYSEDYDDADEDDDKEDRDDRDDEDDDLDSDDEFDEDLDFSLYEDEDDYEDYYDDDYDYDEDYLFPSDSEYITREYLDGLTRDEVALVRNEIYARHGYIFGSEPYKSYFGEKDWYYPNSSFSDSIFNAIERANKDFIVKYESEKGWR